jgi:ABC-type lipoprotein release transport system permease subunit
MVRSSEASRGVLIVGIEPEKEKRISRIEYYTKKEEGSRFLSSPDDDSILISQSMAEKLDLLVGDRLVVMIQDRDNRITGVGLKVEGLFETPVSSFDKNVVFMGIDKLQEVTGIGENISELTVILDNKKRVDRIKQEFISSINNKNLEILSWKDMAPNLVSAIKLFDNMMYIFFSIIFITVIFSVANTLIMAIMERFHEIGVMKSIGTRPRLIFFMVLFEAVNLGIVGLLGGMVAAIVVVLILSVTGIDLSFYMESMRTWGTGSIIYPVMKTLDVVVATFIVFFTVIVASLYPGIKAARIKPLEALHYV